MNIDDEICTRCKKLNGPYAKKCVYCGHDLSKVHNSQTKKNSQTNYSYHYQSNYTYKNKKQFDYNALNGLNNAGRAQEKIIFSGHVDPFTRKTLYENYDLIASELKVYPTVNILPRHATLPGNMGGFYFSDSHSIEIIDTYYLVSILAHEMRHAFQYVYMTKQFFESSYTDVYGYLDCWIERDARQYAIDYCNKQKYFEEVESLQEYEQQISLCLRKSLSPAALNLDESYFRQNIRQRIDIDDYIPAHTNQELSTNYPDEVYSEPNPDMYDYFHHKGKEKSFANMFFSIITFCFFMLLIIFIKFNNGNDWLTISVTIYSIYTYLNYGIIREYPYRYILVGSILTLILFVLLTVTTGGFLLDSVISLLVVSAILRLKYYFKYISY